MEVKVVTPKAKYTKESLAIIILLWTISR